MNRLIDYIAYTRNLDQDIENIRTEEEPELSMNAINNEKSRQKRI